MNDITKATLKTWGVELTAAQRDKLLLFESELLEKNSRFNLISENDAGNIWPRHILDALAAVPLLRRLVPAGGAVADAGTGAGFPGIPLAIALENLEFDLWDSNLKRINFLTWEISRLGLKNTRAFHRRIGQSGELETAKYDAALERAMGKLDNILPQCLNMVKAGGAFLAWQSAKPESGAEETAAYRLPGEERDRFIAVFRKRKN